MKPVSSGYAAVNGIMMCHEFCDEGEPLGLINGGLTIIGKIHGWVQPLGAEAARDRGRDAGPRPRGGHGPSDELSHDGRRHRGAV